MKKLITITLAILIFTFTACEKKFNPAAPEHEPGRIVTCKIDGEEWSHGVESCAMCHSLIVDYYSNEKRLYFTAENNFENPFDNWLNIYIYIYILTLWDWHGCLKACLYTLILIIQVNAPLFHTT